ncbi:unnamed protein product, partial [Didymodactylos carnosus]
VCNDESNELYTAISNSSDILIQFTSSELALHFLNQITSDKRTEKSEFNFVLLHSEPWSETMITRPPPSIDHLKNPSFEKAYGLHELLDTMGYVFQDKYRQSRAIQNILHDQRADYDFYYYQTYLAKRKKEDKPTPSKENGQYTIPCCTLTPLRTIYRQFETNSGSRALRHPQFQSSDQPNFLLVHFREEDNTKLKDFNEQIKRRLKLKMTNGLDCVYKNYKFIGSSTSQLKELSFWFILLPDNMKTVDQAIASLGEFATIKNLATHVARVGQFFSTTKTVEINLTFIDQNKPTKNQRYYACRIDDIERNNYNFTDGCAKISLGLAAEVAQKLKLEKDNIPSAYQVRVAGCKGMLAIDYESNQNDFYIKVRKSMKKFDSPHWNLEICDWSRPMPLSLNNQVILLLSDLGNELPIFLSLQQQSLIDSNTNSVVAQKQSNYAIVKENLLKNRIPIPPKDGRNMFGIPDETGQLKYGECFIQYTCLDGGSSKGKLRIVEGDVLVTKNPCLYPGDFRKLTAVNVPQLREYIRDCIVFPVNGPRPHSNEISGSDLDGDQYWVYWGKDFHINQVVPPLSYTPADKTEVPRITHELIIDHIVNTFGTAKQGLICDIHLAVANIIGVRSEQCKSLAELFARAVDAPKTGEDVPMDLVEQYRHQYAYRHGYPQYMMKFNQRICRSDSVMEQLFLNGKKILFNQMEKYSFSYKSSSPRQHQRSVEQKSLTILNNNENQPLANDNTSSLPATPTKKKSSSSSKSATATPKDQRSSSSSASSINIEGLTTPFPKPIQNEPCVEPKTKSSNNSRKTQQSEASLINMQHSQSSMDSGLASAGSSLRSLNFVTSSITAEYQDFILVGMTRINNLIKITYHDSSLYSVSLSNEPNKECNQFSKLVTNLTASGIFKGKQTKYLEQEHGPLTMIVSYGKIYFKSDDQSQPPKYISDIIKGLNENKLQVEVVTKNIDSVKPEGIDDKKQPWEYLFDCKNEQQLTYYSLTYDQKKKLKKISVFHSWWKCYIKDIDADDTYDTIYEFRSQLAYEEKNPLFKDLVQQIFSNPTNTDLLEGTARRIEWKPILNPTVQPVSLKMIARLHAQPCDGTGDGGYFNLVKNIGLEQDAKTKKSESSDTMEFRVTPVLINNKEQLEQLCELAESSELRTTFTCNMATNRR